MATTSARADSAADPPRRVRADAARNLDALVTAATSCFAESGVDVPMRDIAAAAGVGVGTLYRHFPKRSDLIQAVFKREVDACAEAAAAIAEEHPPAEAVTAWLLRFTDFVATKRGLGAALHSGDPAYDALPGYFTGRLGPTLAGLLHAAAAAGEIRADVDAEELLVAVSRLGAGPGTDGQEQSRRMVRLLVDGLRFGAPGA
ncbi:AcrR family transcriptional regulator [Motilibacter peucedani]|uniref:AcrR family transcriptional regulator n=1 Tax=Motilibacter peucedani TaxID=598650 RepID=A0A420XSL5_9ACTN|nr:TetR/AcrR family transcriptional regulator [Motilibacter peucedani]RKS77820.1 AcrR family transcriptional regulator [Motilibacter peucedani]